MSSQQLFFDIGPHLVRCCVSSCDSERAASIIENGGSQLWGASIPPNSTGTRSIVRSEPLKITLSRGLFSNRFEVDIAYKNLPDGRIDFRVDVPKEEASFYQVQVVEMRKGSTWNELFSSELSEIPNVASYREGIATPSR